VLGLWIEQTEGAKFWLRVVNDLKLRGVQDILIAVVDGLKGFPEAINTVFPETTVQTCIVHLIRNSLDFASWKDRKQVAAELKEVYRAPSAEAAAQALEAFDASLWGRKYPPIAALWRRAWEQVIPFFAFAPDIRKIIYTTNSIESLHMQLRKIIKARGHFPSDEAALKLIWLALRNVVAKWGPPKGIPLSESTKRKLAALLSHVFTVARKRWRMNVKNPVTEIELPRSGRSRNRRLEDGEEVRLLAELAKARSAAVVVPLVRLAVETAMRQGELLALTWADVRMVGDHGTATLHDTENGDGRIVPLLLALVRSWEPCLVLSREGRFSR
jgi:hypothetical protein